MKNKRWFYMVVGLQALFLLLMSIAYYAIDLYGEPVHLETEPVDPRDPFYGDYVTLAYEIESIPPDKWSGERNPERGTRVFMIIEEDEEGIHRLKEASTQWLEAGNNETMIQARLDWHNDDLHTYQVTIGLNRYYIEENSGEKFETRGKRVVNILIAPWGQKKIVSLTPVEDF